MNNNFTILILMIIINIIYNYLFIPNYKHHNSHNSHNPYNIRLNYLMIDDYN